MAEGDPLKTVEQLLSGAWITANTDNLRPLFFVSSEQPQRLDYTFSTKTNVLLYPVSHLIKPNDLSSDYREETNDRISIDIRTKKSRDHLRKCYLEAKRIIGASTVNPSSEYPYLESVETKDISTHGFHCYVFDVRLRNWNVVK